MNHTRAEMREPGNRRQPETAPLCGPLGRPFGLPETGLTYKTRFRPPARSPAGSYKLQMTSAQVRAARSAGTSCSTTMMGPVGIHEARSFASELRTGLKR